MRNLEQRIAEIDRRSKKILKERKRRGKRILMACIPLVLCIGLCILPAMMTDNSATGDPGANGAVTGDRPESFACSVAKIEVSGIGVSRVYTEPSEVLLISNRLYAYAVQSPESGGSGTEVPDGGVSESGREETYGGDGLFGSVAGTAELAYTITLTLHDGRTTEYHLAGNTLEDRNTKQTYTLAQTGLIELKDLLGIPDP